MKKFLISLFLVLVSTVSLQAFDKVVLWGHKLHTDTHSYIHEAFYRGFRFLDFEIYWFDKDDDVTDFDFSNTLFITEGQEDTNIPLRSDCVYFLHNTDQTKYQKLSLKTIAFQVYTDDVLTRSSCKKIDTCIYYDIPARCMYMPWATDMLPYEIEELKLNLPSVRKSNVVYWIGTVGEGRFGNKSELNPFIEACNDNGIEFIACNPWATGISRDDHIQIISSAYMAPAIVGEWQKKVGYIPCRIFKNISYGQVGITNSLRVSELFEGKLVYNPDTYQLFYDAQKRLENLTWDDLFELMDIVKTKHTYVNRINTMLDFLEILENGHHFEK